MTRHRTRNTASVAFFLVALLGAALLGSSTKASHAVAAAQPPVLDTGPNWVSLGPEPIVPVVDLQGQQILSPPVSGRATVMAVNPQNRYNVWFGTAGGGLWVTNNIHIGGLTDATVKPDLAGANFDRTWQPVWYPHNDGFESLSIGAIALDESRCSPSGCLTAYVGTGENSLRRDTYYGDGVYRVDWGGPVEFPRWSWTRLDTDEQFKYGSTAGLVPDADELFVALSAGNTTTSVYATVRAPEPAAGYGVHRRDGAGNWTQVFETTSNGEEDWADLLLPTDIEKDLADSDVFLLGVMNDGIFRTSDRGNTWCALNPGSRLRIASAAGQISTPISDCSSGTGLPAAGTFDHVELAVESATKLYALFGNCPSGYTSSTQGATSVCQSGGSDRSPFLYRSTDGGATWSQPGVVDGAHYSRYTHALKSVAPDQVLWGGLRPYLLDMRSSGFDQVPLAHGTMHLDMHDLTAYGGWDAGGDVFYAATDGGFYYLATGANVWRAGNDSLITTAFVNIGIDYEDEAPGDDLPRTTAILGGLQDNSNAAYNGSEKWQLWGPIGDGGEALIQTPLITYDSVQDNSIRRIPGFGGFSSSVGGTRINNEEDASFYSVLVQHEDSKRVFVATDVISVRDGTPAAWDSTSAAAKPPAIQISPVLGTDGNNYPAIETDRDLITAMAVAPSHGWRVYAGLYSGQLWRSTTGPGVQPTSAAGDWMRVDAGLPAGTISSIAVHPTDEDRLWVAFSDFLPQTVWFSDNAGESWTPRSAGLPPSEPIKVIKVVPDEPAKLWLGTDTGVYLSTDSGVNWELRSGNLPRVPVFDIEVDRHTNRVFAATHGRGVWMLTDEGPVLTTFEGWMDDGIWDIPIYGTGFSCSQPGGCTCTVDVEREDGTVCATGTQDAMMNRIFVPQGDHTLRTENMGSCTRCEGKPVVWACFNGDCVGGTKLSVCNQDGHRVSAVRVRCEDNPEASGSVAGFCPVQNDPPSNLFEVTPELTVPGTDGDGPAPAALGGTQFLMLAPTVLTSSATGGDRVLCTAPVEIGPGLDDVQLDLLDAINTSASCQAAGVSASVVQETSLSGEDIPDKPDQRLALSAPSVPASQLILGVAALPGQAAELCFNMSKLGVYLANQVAVTQMRFPTGSGGAAGGEIRVEEVSPVGYCAMRVPTSPGQTGEQIAQAVAAAFQAPGVPSPATCPESNNPRDIVQDGDSVVAVLPTSLRVCIQDENVGFEFGPHGLDIAPVEPSFEYAAKIVCGSQTDPADMRLARGFYATSINVHNPSPSGVTLWKKLALAYPPEEQAPGELLRIGTDQLRPGEALKTDCLDVRRQLFPDGFPTSYIEGFVVVQSTDNLDVVSVYSTATLDVGGVAKDHSSLHIQQVPERRIKRQREKPVDEDTNGAGEPTAALLCYQAHAADTVDAVVELSTQFARHPEVSLGSMKLLCGPVYKAHEKEELPGEPPPLLPLSCYAMEAESPNTSVHLADRNGFYDGTARIGSPDLFCDPALEGELVGQPAAELTPYPSHLVGYGIRADRLTMPATVYTRDRWGVREISFRESAYLLEPATKNDPNAALPEEPPLHCYLVEQPASSGETLGIVDQFGEHEVYLRAPALFCDPAMKTTE